MSTITSYELEALMKDYEESFGYNNYKMRFFDNKVLECKECNRKKPLNSAWLCEECQTD